MVGGRGACNGSPSTANKGARTRPNSRQGTHSRTAAGSDQTAGYRPCSCCAATRAQSQHERTDYYRSGYQPHVHYPLLLFRAISQEQQPEPVVAIPAASSHQ
jgi:hypothetical protein